MMFRLLAVLALLPAGAMAQPSANRPARADHPAPAKADGPKPTLPPEWASMFNWRDIGPAGMSGRITDIAVYEKDPCTWWAATASGGLLKTTNDGVTWTHQFDDQPTVSIGAVCVAPSDSNIVWVGTGESNPRNSVSWGDGVYKSTDGGATWKNMGLKDSFQVGSIVIDPVDPNVVYVGALGRLWGHNDERGLYKTTDAGETWERVLSVDDKTGVIDIELSPADPNLIMAATYERQRDDFDENDPAKKWGPGSAIYRSTDAGASWTKISAGLPTNDLGRVDIEFYRKSPNVVYALVESSKIGEEPENAPYLGVEGRDAEVGARLTAVTDESPAKTAGLEVDDIVVAVEDEPVISYDDFIAHVRHHLAGDTVKLTLSRDRKKVELEVTFAHRPGSQEDKPKGDEESDDDDAPAAPFRTWLGGQVANVQDQQGPEGHEYGGLYRSDDAGETWARINSINPRPMYFSCLRVDPGDDNYIYVAGVELFKSSDGGKTFTDDGHQGENGETHVDHHAMWIDPADGRHIILGNDGGLYVTRDRMTNWDHHNQFAIAQCYHVAVGPRRDYRVYTGLQDNGSWGGPNRSSSGDGPINQDWFRIGGGDGFVCAVDQNDPDLLYAESQNAGIVRWNVRTGERAFLRPNAPRGTSYRWCWRTPYLLSHHNSRIWYAAGNYVFRSVDSGSDPKPISPEITNTDHGAATALDESPRDPDVLYVGTDDGAFWTTRDAGKTWTDLFPGHKQEPKPKDEKAKESDAAQPASAETESDADPQAKPESEAKSASEPMAESKPEPARRAPADPHAVPQRIRPGTPMPRHTEPAPAPKTESPPKPEPEPQSEPTPEPQPQAESAAQPETEPAPQPAEAPAQHTDPIAGTWDAKATSDAIPEDQGKFDFDIERTDVGDYAGAMHTVMGDGDITDVQFDPETGDVSFVCKTAGASINLKAKVDAETMTGTGAAPQMGLEFTFTATRRPPAGQKEKAPAGPTLAELVPGPRRVSCIDASRFEDGRVYITLDGHYQDDDAPYLLVSEDFGASWRSLVANLPPDCGTCRAIREDIHNQDVLYLGTEFDLLVSIDRGGTWTSLTDATNLPTVAIHEIAQHEASGDLIVATHGRGVWIMNATALRQLSVDTIAEAAHLYQPADVVYWQSDPSRPDDLRAYEGENPDIQAEIYYSISGSPSSVTLEIRDATGKVVQTLDASDEPGLHKATWNLRTESQGRRRFAPRVEPGPYRVVLTVDDLAVGRTLSVISDPGAPDAQLWGEAFDEWESVLDRMGDEEEDEDTDGID